MIPQNSDIDLQQDFDIEEEPTSTFKINTEKQKIIGRCDGLEAVKQAVYLILNTERFKWIIFSGNYGVEFEELYGKPIPYVLPELKRRITEALTQDDRITSVDDFDFEVIKNKVMCSFTVRSNFGDFSAGNEVNI